MLGKLMAGAGFIALIVILVLIYGHSRASEGGSKVRIKDDAAHAASVTAARADERGAAVSAQSTADHLARADASSTVLVQTAIEDIHNAIATPAPVGDIPASAPVDQLRASINAGVDRSNRSADAADAIL